MICGADNLCRSNPAILCQGLLVDGAVPADPDAPIPEEPDAPPPDEPDAMPPDEPDAPLPDEPDAALPEPDAAEPEPDAPLPPPDAPPPPPDASPPPPDAGVPPCTGDIVTVDDFDTNTTIIFDTRLVIGPDGHEHVTFVAQTNPDEILLFHSDRAPASSAGWRTEKVALAQDYLIGQTLDDAGVVHATFAGENGLVYLARRLDFADWTIEPVSTAVAWNSSVAVEASGHVDVVYHTAGTFVHARRTRSGTQWLRNPIEMGATPGQQQSMAISPTGVLTVAYLHRPSFSPYELKLGEWAPLGAWQITPLERSGDPGHYPAMTIDEAGSLHIVHGDYQNLTLNYLRLDPDGNRRDLVVFDENAWLGRYNGIAIDRQGNIHVTGEDRDSGRLRHGVLRRDGRAFAMSTVEEVGAIEGRSSIAVAPDGRVFVSYPNAGTGHVRVAELCVD